jgi:hypothetical protein
VWGKEVELEGYLRDALKMRPPTVAHPTNNTLRSRIWDSRALDGIEQDKN